MIFICFRAQRTDLTCQLNTELDDMSGQLTVFSTVQIIKWILVAGRNLLEDMYFDSVRIKTLGCDSI